MPWACSSDSVGAAERCVGQPRVALGQALRGVMGSGPYFSAVSQEKTGDFWVNGRLFGHQTCHTTEDVEHADYVLFIGTKRQAQEPIATQAARAGQRGEHGRHHRPHRGLHQRTPDDADDDTGERVEHAEAHGGRGDGAEPLGLGGADREGDEAPERGGTRRA